MKILLKNASQIVTFHGSRAIHGALMNDAVAYTNADVVIKDGIIADVGQSLDGTDCDIFDCTGKTLTAGLIDCHTHFIFTGDRSAEFSMRLSGATYMEIMNAGGGIINTVRATREATLSDLIGAGAKRLDAYLAQGVTTIEGKSGYGLDEITELRQIKAMEVLNATHAVDVIATYMGAHATPKEWDKTSYVDYICNTVIPLVATQSKAEFVDAFCEEGVFTVEQCERVLLCAKAHGLHTKLHADEIVSLGGSALACRLGATSIEHLLHITDSDIARLASSDTVGVTLPLTAFSLKENYAPARKMIDAGCAVATASDLNPGSCYSNSIPMLFALCCIPMNMTVRETLCALTLNAAAAINRAQYIGSIEKGKRADITIWDMPNIDYFAYNFGVNHASAVFKNGKLVFNK